MRNYLVGAALAASFASAYDAKKLQADGDFTQANCDKTDSNPYYVKPLPGYDNTNDDWPCSYAGTVASDANGAH